MHQRMGFAEIDYSSVFFNLKVLNALMAPRFIFFRHCPLSDRAEGNAWLALRGTRRRQGQHRIDRLRIARGAQLFGDVLVPQ